MWVGQKEIYNKRKTPGPLGQTHTVDGKILHHLGCPKRLCFDHGSDNSEREKQKMCECVFVQRGLCFFLFFFVFSLVFFGCSWGLGFAEAGLIKAGPF